MHYASSAGCGLRMLVVLVNVSLFRGIGDTEAAEESRFDQNMSLHPYFDFDVVRNVTARVGQTAFLNCRVEQLGDKSVSWIRKRDLHILTAGILTYTSDERFQVIRPENSDHWTLQIKFPQMRDTGIYECQVNTEPKMSMAFRLNVVEAKAEIHGPRDLYVKMGSLVTLSCKVSQGPHELGMIHWYRGSMPLDPKTIRHPNDAAAYDQPGRISIDTEWTDSLRSRLKVKSAKLSDSGNYSCLPTMAEGDSVTVHIINGEHPAAMQRGDGHVVRPPPAVMLVLMLLVTAVLMRLQQGHQLRRQQHHPRQQHPDAPELCCRTWTACHQDHRQPQPQQQQWPQHHRHCQCKTSEQPPQRWRSTATGIAMRPDVASRTTTTTTTKTPSLTALLSCLCGCGDSGKTVAIPGTRMLLSGSAGSQAEIDLGAHGLNAR